MNPAQLLNHFDRLADAPDAVPRMRRFVLDLAVRGKLVEQDPNDEPAAELLKRIQADKVGLVREGILKKGKSQPSVGPEEVSFRVPLGWEFERLGQICGLENGDRSKNYPSHDEFVPTGIPFINAGHLAAGEVALDDMNYITEQCFHALKSGKTRNGDILFCLRGSLGKFAIVKGIAQAAIASSLVIIRLAGHVNENFILAYLGAPLAVQMVRRFDNGTAQPNLSSNDLAKFVIPLPPLAEQHRIVAKVDELMALCDRLEAAQAERESRRDRLVRASLHRLHQPASDPATFRDHVRFHLQHLPRTAGRPEHIGQLRQTILNLAIRGKLLPQDPNDESASTLLNHRA